MLVMRVNETIVPFDVLDTNKICTVSNVFTKYKTRILREFLNHSKVLISFLYKDDIILSREFNDVNEISLTDMWNSLPELNQFVYDALTTRDYIMYEVKNSKLDICAHMIKNGEILFVTDNYSERFALETAEYKRLVNSDNERYYRSIKLVNNDKIYVFYLEWCK